MTRQMEINYLRRYTLSNPSAWRAAWSAAKAGKHWSEAAIIDARGHARPMQWTVIEVHSGQRF